MDIITIKFPEDPYEKIMKRPNINKNAITNFYRAITEIEYDDFGNQRPPVTKTSEAKYIFHMFYKSYVDYKTQQAIYSLISLMFEKG